MIVWVELSVGGVIIPKLGGAIRGACHLIQVGSVGRSGRSVGSGRTFIQRQVWGNDKSGETSSASVGGFSRGICARARSPDADSVCLPHSHELVILFFFCRFDLHIHTMYGCNSPRLRGGCSVGQLTFQPHCGKSSGPQDGISRGERYGEVHHSNGKKVNGCA